MCYLEDSPEVKGAQGAKSICMCIVDIDSWGHTRTSWKSSMEERDWCCSCHPCGDHHKKVLRLKCINKGVWTVQC